MEENVNWECQNALRSSTDTLQVTILQMCRIDVECGEGIGDQALPPRNSFCHVASQSPDSPFLPGLRLFFPSAKQGCDPPDCGAATFMSRPASKATLHSWRSSRVPGWVSPSSFWGIFPFSSVCFPSERLGEERQTLVSAR